MGNDSIIKALQRVVHEVDAILSLRYREENDRKEWALISKKKGKDGKRKVLYWFGPRKPSKEKFQEQERRVQYFKHKG